MKVWEMMAKLDKNFNINEACEEWGSCGLPSDEGVGSPEGHLMEDEEIAGLDDEGMEFAEDEFESVEEEMPEIEGEEVPEAEEEFDEDEFDFEEFDDENAEGAEPEEPEEAEGAEEAEADMENPESSELDELRAEIESLKAQLAELKGEEPEMGEEPVEDDLGIEEPNFDETEMDGADEFAEEPEMEDEPAGEEVEETFDPEIDANYEDEPDFGLDEARKAELESIIEGLTQRYLNEDKLNVFGKHPGYRKKPMTLPATGSDGDEKTTDWNDESVYSEQPFGEKIGDSAPFEKAIEKIVDSVMEGITKKKI